MNICFNAYSYVFMNLARVPSAARDYSFIIQYRYSILTLLKNSIKNKRDEFNMMLSLVEVSYLLHRFKLLVKSLINF